MLLLDSSKSKKTIGWIPRLDIDSALRMTIDWYKAFFYNENCISIVD